MFEQFRDDLSVYREGILAQGFWAVRVHRFGIRRKAVKTVVLRKIWGAFYLVLAKLTQIIAGIYIGPNVRIGRRLQIEHFGNIIIHSEVSIGDDVIIRQGVTIGNRRLDAPLDVPTIGDRVNIGAGAKILGKVTIGNDAHIGANAVVLSDVPAGAVAVGIPATIKLSKTMG